MFLECFQADSNDLLNYYTLHLCGSGALHSQKINVHLILYSRGNKYGFFNASHITFILKPSTEREEEISEKDHCIKREILKENDYTIDHHKRRKREREREIDR